MNIGAPMTGKNNRFANNAGKAMRLYLPLCPASEPVATFMQFPSGIYITITPDGFNDQARGFLLVAANRRSRRTPGRQAEKSAATRQAAIEAAVDCFVNIGYSRSSTIEIAKRAHVSRGAMIHHFPSKRKLLEATVEYIISERIRRFTADMRRAVFTVEDRLSQRGIDIYWKHLNSRLFTAFHELVTASRTDAELARVLKAATLRFDKVWYQTVELLFPEWKGKDDLLGLAQDLTRFLLEGMALNKLSHDAKQRRLRIREYLKLRLREILAAGERPEREGAVQDFLRGAK